MIGRSIKLAVVLPLLLGACGDPLDRPGTLHAVGVNRANLDQAVVNKTDLVLGHEDPGSDAIMDAAATARLHADHPRALPIVSTGGGS